jgi:NHLM bacteriocin system ABC transporter peptidase/ATP-binding protein
MAENAQSEAAGTASEEPEKPRPTRKPPRRRVKTPTVLQMEAVECGAAALATVLAYHRLWVPLEELRHECGVSRDGSKASNILRAARKYGVEAKGYKWENLDDLYDLSFPIILFWNFNHFVVLEGFKGGKVFLNDPAQGPRVVTLDELDASYSGIVLAFKPGPEFRTGGSAPNLIPALRRRLKGSSLALWYVILCGLLLVIPGLVIPTFTRVFIDDYLIGAQRWLVQPLLAAMAVAVVIQGALTWLQKHYLLRLETKLALATSSRFFNHVLRLPAAYFGQRFAGEIGSRVAINDKVAKVISGKLATTVIDSVMTVFYAALMMFYDVTLTVAVIGIALLNVVAVRLAARLRTDSSRRLQLDRGKLTGTAMNGLKMIETLKASGAEGEFFARWSGYYAKSLNTKQQLAVITQLSGAVPPFVQTMSTAVVLTLGGLKVMSGELTVGMLVAYQTLLASFTRPLISFVQFGATLQELQADANRLDDVLKYPQDPQYEAETQPRSQDGPRPIKLQGRVEARSLTFGYSPLEKPLIQDFSLVVEPGRRVALVGGSGSGKSTVAKLLSGLYKPWTGEILLDGVPRDSVDRKLIVNSVGMVDQDIFLFGGTATENVTMWDPTIVPERIGTACRDAAIAEVLESREGGYQAAVIEGGGNFSGGQCQRIEIARALVGDPSVLILDEATSALDPSTEASIDAAIRRRGCTCIIIAHRLSTIKDCDEIVVMDRGRIVQRGTHEEMKDLDGPYQRLISLH